MSLRGLWIIDPNISKGEKPTVVFKRVFPTVEKRVKVAAGSSYKKIPQNLAHLVVDELNLYRKSYEFDEQHDSCSKLTTPPIYSLLDGQLKPFVIIKKLHLLFCCLPHVDQFDMDPEKMFLLPGIALGYSLMQNIATYICSGNEPLESKLSNLHMLVSTGLPFGTPSEVDISTLSAMLSTREGAPLPKTKGPAWRPVAFKGKQNIHISIKESIQAVQYCRDEVPDVCEVYGSINCKADLEENTEVLIGLSAPIETATLSNLINHPCVQLSDELGPALQPDEQITKGQLSSRRLRFCPPFDTFQLCHYKTRMSETALPIQVIYQMKGEASRAEISINLKLAPGVKNSFEVCQVHMPFFNRGPIKTASCVPQSANVLVAPDHMKLLWDVGQKFPGKSREFSLQITVEFDTNVEIRNEDPFLKGLNSFIQISFKLVDYTYSGLKIDNKSIELSPSGKIKTQITTEFEAVDYKIWNSLGDVICSSPT